VALSRAYLGDVAVATANGSSIAVRVERHFMHHFGPVQTIPISRVPVTTLVATMDFRSDVLLAWQQGSAVYAHMLRASGRSDPTQKVGPSAPDPQLQALVSDNDHGTVAWASPAAPNRPGSATRIYVNLSSAGVRFGAPHTVASFADPAQAGRSPGSLELVRLSNENAVLAWTDVERGRYLVRGAPIVAAAGGRSTRLSDAHGDAVLAGLAPGPAGEAIALWTSPRRGETGPRAPRTQLWAARTFSVPHNRLEERAPELIAAPGALEALSVAVDPGDDHALAAWRTQSDSRSIGYAVGQGVGAGAESAARRRAERAVAGAAPPGSATPWLAIALACAAVVGLAGLLARRWRRRPSGARGRGIH
jgi:hypothetical protein